MENVFSTMTVYGANSWQVTGNRNFSEEEINAVRNNVVVDGKLDEKTGEKYGKSVCFFMMKGGQTYIPLSNRGNDAPIGSSIDMRTAKLLTLHREGDGNIMRVEI